MSWGNGLFTKPAKKGCIEFCHEGFVIINPNIFFMEQFEGWFLKSSKRHGTWGHRPGRDLHPVAGRRIFKMVFEIICGPSLLKFFQAENFVALAERGSMFI